MNKKREKESRKAMRKMARERLSSTRKAPSDNKMGMGHLDEVIDI